MNSRNPERRENFIFLLFLTNKLPLNLLQECGENTEVTKRERDRKENKEKRKREKVLSSLIQFQPFRCGIFSYGSLTVKKILTA